jgi:hypothetical protein
MRILVSCTRKLTRPRDLQKCEQVMIFDSITWQPVGLNVIYYEKANMSQFHDLSRAKEGIG